MGEKTRAALVGAFLILSFSPLVPTELRIALYLMLAPICAVMSWRRLTPRAAYILMLFGLTFAYSLIVDLQDGVAFANRVTLSQYYFPVCAAAGFFLAAAIRQSDYLDALERAMFVLSAISVALFALFMANESLVYSLPEYRFEDLRHRTAGFINILFADGFLVHRNSGFASEPGAFQILVNLALYWNLKKRGPMNWRTAVYMATLITGGSTTGLIVMVLVFALFAPLWFRAVLVAIAFAASTYVVGLAAYHAEFKFGGAAYEARALPTLKAIDEIAETPTGLGAVEFTVRAQSRDINSFDSFTQMGMRYGVHGLILLLFCLAALALRNPAVALIIGLGLLTNTFWYIPPLSCFLFWPFMEPRYILARQPQNRDRSLQLRQSERRRRRSLAVSEDYSTSAR